MATIDGILPRSVSDAARLSLFPISPPIHSGKVKEAASLMKGSKDPADTGPLLGPV